MKSIEAINEQEKTAFDERSRCYYIKEI